MKIWTLQDVAAHWDNEPHYDEINSKIDSYFRRFTDSAPLFQIPEGARVLDIDCRTAKGTVFFTEKYPTAHFQCMAMSPTFKERAEHTLQKNTVNAPVGIFNTMPLPFEDQSFDMILTYETLEHVPWPARYIKELSRVLMPGGQLVLTTPNVLWEPVHWLSATLHLDHGEGPHRMVPRREIFAAFREAGLEVITEKTFVLIPAGPKWLLAIGKYMERVLPEWILRIIALRRTFICTKHV
jgi:SAM-dependent methyltransferase